MQMLIGHAGTIIGKGEIVELFIAADAGNPHHRTVSGIRHGVVHEVAEYRIEHRGIGIYHQCRRQCILHTHVKRSHLLVDLLKQVRYKLRKVYMFPVHALHCTTHLVQLGDILYKGVEPVALAVATAEEMHQLFIGKVARVVLHYGLKITLYAAHRCLELMGNILCELPFHA